MFNAKYLTNWLKIPDEVYFKIPFFDILQNNMNQHTGHRNVFSILSIFMKIHKIKITTNNKGWNNFEIVFFVVKIKKNFWRRELNNNGEFERRIHWQLYQIIKFLFFDLFIWSLKYMFIINKNKN